MQITDKLATTKAYQAAGFAPPQAEAMAEQHEAVAEEIHAQLTKSMTEAISNSSMSFQSSLALVKADLETAIAKVSAEQTRFTVTVGAIIVGILGLLMTAYRFFQ